MGFLSGVLSNIKEHLGQHKDTIDIAINILEQNKHLGKKGFNAAIGKVVAGVRKYNGYVKNSNKKVSEPIAALLTYFNTENNGEFTTGFNAMQVASVSDKMDPTDPEVTKAVDLVTQCLEKANEFNGKLDFSAPKNKRTQNAINDLNHELRVRVHSVRETVKYETDRLTTLSRKEKENYDAIVKMVRKLEDIKSCVKSKIEEDVTKLVTKLKNDVQNILVALESISKILAQYVKDFDWWMKETDDVIRLAEEKVEKILEEVYKGSEKKKAVSAAANMIRQQAFSLREAGNNAKTKVAETVKLALTQVKVMNDALKQDLFTVKDKIKEAVKALGEKLDKDVKEGLWAIEEAIRTPVDEIVGSAQGFLTKFQATKAALQVAIDKIATDIEKLKDLEKLDTIEGAYNRHVSAPLLKSLSGKTAFQPLTNYIERLDGDVMKKVKAAMQQIGTAMGEMYAYSKVANLSVDLDSIIPPEISTVTIGGQTMQKVKNLNITNHTKAINSVLQMSNSMKTFTKTDATKLLTEFGNIAQSVSQHAKLVVNQAMEQIREKLDSELSEVSEFMQEKTRKIKDGIQYNTFERDFDYGGGIQINARGLPKLLSDFRDNIKQKLENLQQTVIPQAFKTNPPGSMDPKTYIFGSDLMTAFHDTYEKNLKEGDIKTEGGTGKSVLDQEIGGDILGSGIDATQKISNLATGKFANYEQQVKQDSLTSGEPTQLDGQLPSKIKEIQTQVEEALTSITTLDSAAQTQLNAVNARLDELCKAVTDAAEKGPETAKGRLTELKRRIGKTLSGDVNSLMALNAKLKKLQDVDLQNVIRSAEKFLKPDADRAGEHVIKELTKEVDDKLTEAKKELTKQTNTHYVTTMHYLLQQFADKVRGQLDKLPEAIEDDLTIGFKGFMGAFQGQNGQVVKYDNIEQLTNMVKCFSKNPTDYKENFEKLANNFQSFWQPLYSYLKEEIKRVHAANKERINPKPTDVVQLYTSKIDSVTNELYILLNHLREHNRYDHKVPALLDILSTKVGSLHPASFSEPNTPLLETVALGFRGLVGELKKAYISSYDSETFGAELVEKEKLTAYGTKLSKVCLTVVSTSYNVLNTVRKYSVTTWRSEKIHQSTPIGQFLGNNGYVVSKDKQDGQLRNGDGMLGWHVYKSLVKNADGRVYKHHDADKDTGPLKTLHDCLETYYEVCHQSTFASKRQPSSVFEMLCWLCGLPCNSVYDALLLDTMSDLFEDPKKQTKEAGDDHEFTLVTPDALYLNAYPSNITYDNSVKAVRHLCLRSYDLLTAILGTGDAYSMYAVDFCSNSLNLHYPSKGDDCLQMLLDILRCLLPSLNFLRSQCKLTAEHRGWSDCWYGKGVQSSKSQCNDHSEDKAACQANGQPKCQAKCQPTSPLQSYLSDCLTGHLPHQVSSIGCKAKCATCPKVLPGQPCITPLGFRGFSGNMRTGKDLCKALTKFFFDVQYSSLLCLMPKPPSTLPEHYQFVSTLVRMLDNGKGVNGNAVKTAFETATKEMCIELYKDTSDFTNALQKAYRSHDSSRHAKYSEADLSTLSVSTPCTFASSDKIHCAPYLRSLCEDSYTYLAEKHSKLYFSWALYLPLTLYDYLKSLFDSFSNISCRDWGCSPCTHGTKCSRGKHGVENCQCRGVVECRGVSSTFYSYGFTFGDSTKLHGENSRSYCHHFYIQLKNVLQSTHFTALFKECDNYMWMIRQPFIWLNVALWSLSLFYLICVMVGRLDVLHIRSHLRIPSSHRIAAQSLLAAAQVGRLAKISYLQP